MKEIRLNGHTFTVHKSKYVRRDSFELERYAGRTLYDCYDRPSEAKKAIYKEWEEWAYLNNVMYFGVSSYNGFRFSLQGMVQHEGTLYLLSITSSSKKAYIIDEQV